MAKILITLKPERFLEIKPPLWLVYVVSFISYDGILSASAITCTTASASKITTETATASASTSTRESASASVIESVSTNISASAV